MYRLIFSALLLVVVLHTNAYCQLPPRPAVGEVEEPVASELALKLDDLFEQYSANYKLINRFVGVASLDRTYKSKGEPLNIDLMWFIHAQDFEKHVRRMDEQIFALGPLRDGTQRPGVSNRVTIETSDGAFQYETANSTRSIRRDSVKKEDEFERSFRIQTRLNFWELPFRGSIDVRFEGTLPKAIWREEPSAPALFQEGGRVTASYEDLRQVLARVSFDSGFAYDFTFSKADGNMPIRVVLSRNDQRVRGITAVVDTKWYIHRSDDYPRPVYLPRQVYCEFESTGGTAHDTHELSIRWLVGKDVDDYIFSQDSEFFVPPLEIRETVLAKAVNRD